MDNNSKKQNEQWVNLYKNDQEQFAKSLEAVKDSEDSDPVEMKEIAEALPEDFLIRFPDYFLYATPKQWVYLYKNDQELFIKSLDSTNFSGLLTLEEIAKELPEDFLVNVRKYLKNKYYNEFNSYLYAFKDYLYKSTKEQLCYFYKNDEQGFLTEIEKLEPHTSGGIGEIVHKMSDDFAVKYPQYAVYASQKQLQCYSSDDSKKKLQQELESEARNENLTPKQRRELIYKWSQAQGIEYLVHFTRLHNLRGIMEKGLITRTNLEKSNASFSYTDPLRLDNMRDSICLSVSFPNYKMFFNKKISSDSENRSWCILLLKPEILRDIDCAFFNGNAASSSNRYIDIRERMSLASFAELFEDNGERSKLVKPSDTYATDPQSEILCLGDIPVSKISHCFYNAGQYIWKWSDDDNKKVRSIMDKNGIAEHATGGWYFGRGPYKNYETFAERQAKENGKNNN